MAKFNIELTGSMARRLQHVLSVCVYVCVCMNMHICVYMFVEWRQHMGGP